MSKLRARYFSRCGHWRSQRVAGRMSALGGAIQLLSAQGIILLRTCLPFRSHAERAVGELARMLSQDGVAASQSREYQFSGSARRHYQNLEIMLRPHRLDRAVTASCIPIYRGHKSLHPTVLQGARWVDPADYGHEPWRTIQAPLTADLEGFSRVNAQWLKTEVARAPHYGKVFERIAGVLVGC